MGQSEVTKKAGLKARYLAWRSGWPTEWAKLRLLLSKQLFAIHQGVQLHLRWVLLVAAVAWFTTLFLVAHAFTPELARQFADPARLSAATSLLSGVGGALIGAAAIAFTLILFAMQVNVERMPHGLFRRLSSDRRLLGAFVVSFGLACCVATSALVPHAGWISYALAFALTVITAEVALFVYAYRRALLLINPRHQLSIVVGDVRRAFRRVDRWVERLRPLLGDGPPPAIADEKDAARLAFLTLNRDWAAPARQGIAYATSYARQFAEQGDYEIVRQAYSAVTAINGLYVKTKGQTFFANNFLIDNPLARDAFLIGTLEELRQAVQNSLSRGDERQIDTVISTMTDLVGIYAQIEYGRHATAKSHALIIVGYQESTLTAVIPHKMPDVLMSGVRKLGMSGQTLLFHGTPQDAVSVIDKLGTLGMTGVVSSDYRPVTLEVMEQLTALSLSLLRTTGHDIRIAIGRARTAVTQIADMFLEVPEQPLLSAHSTFLGPYYSSTTPKSFRGQFTQLANAVLDADAENEDAKRVLRHVREWSDGLYAPYRKLIQKAVAKRSGFAFDILTWGFGIFEILLALSNAPAVIDHDRKELRKNAIWLLSSISFLPTDTEAVTFVESSRVTEGLFEALHHTLGRDCSDIADQARNLLLWWTVKAGANDSARGVLGLGIQGLIAATLLQGEQGSPEDLKERLTEELAKPDGPTAEVRQRAARQLRAEADSWEVRDFEMSDIKRALRSTDRIARSALLIEIADLLSPAAPGEPVDDDLIGV